MAVAVVWLSARLHLPVAGWAAIEFLLWILWHTSSGTIRHSSRLPVLSRGFESDQPGFSSSQLADEWVPGLWPALTSGGRRTPSVQTFSFSIFAMFKLPFYSSSCFLLFILLFLLLGKPVLFILYITYSFLRFSERWRVFLGCH